MYDLNDTIVAVSSPVSGKRVIVRITGPNTVGKINQIFSPPINVKRWAREERRRTRLLFGNIAIYDDLQLDAQLYLFLAPHSYTGDDVAEIHIHTNSAVTEALMDSLLKRGLRMAGPGEFTARAYLNGKMDLAQAEAVNEIVVSSNRYQLAAAEKLLSGRLAETTAKIQAEVMDCLSLIEAGLDFSGEDIELEIGPQAIERLLRTKGQLEQLLSGSIRYESVVDLPAVGIAGAPNAGKSSLLNNLAGYERSIVSHPGAPGPTTRDVLTGLLILPHCRCVLFDCAGLIPAPNNILDELAQQAAIGALRSASVVVFCVDISKADWAEDISIHQLIPIHRDTGVPALIPVATKSDLLSQEMLANRLAELNRLFVTEFLPGSAKTGVGIELLRETIDAKLLELTLGTALHQKRCREVPDYVSGVALTARHRQAVTEAIENVSQAVNELKAGNDEVAAMILRAAYQAISGIECGRGGQIDEQILERIFSRFCIGK